MKRKFMVTVQVDITNEELVEYLSYYEGAKINSNGIFELLHYGNKKSSINSAINGVKNRLNWHRDVKDKYKILGAREIIE